MQTQTVINEQKICPNCKAQFICKPAECWCSNLPEKLPMLESGECYCPACIEEILDKKKGAPM